MSTASSTTPTRPLVELNLISSAVDIDGLLAELRADPSLQVEVRETEFAGTAATAWGWIIDPTDPRALAEARDDVSAGAGAIELIEPADGSASFSVFAKASPYRELVLAALRADRRPTFEYQSRFLELKISWSREVPPLRLSFDRGARATASLETDGSGVAFIVESDEYVVWAGSGAGAAAHIRAVEISDRLERYGQLDRIDTSGYVEERDELGLIASMAMSGVWAALMRHSLAERA